MRFNNSENVKQTLTRRMCFHSERLVPHKLFTPLLSGMVATGILLTLILMVLLYKYMQVRKKNNFYNVWHNGQRGNASISKCI